MPFWGWFHKKAKSRAELLRIPWPQAAGGEWIWVHVASLGEFEQIRVFLEDWRKTPGNRLLLSFYSPSGYTQVGEKVADACILFPGEQKKKIVALLQRFQPKIVVFVKAEIWPVCLEVLSRHNVSAALVAFSPGKSKAMQGITRHFWKKAFEQYAWISCQDQAAREFLQSLGIPPHRIYVDGNPRIDRVLGMLKDGEMPLPHAQKGALTLVAGSTWEKDDALLFEVLLKRPDWRLIWAPHEPEPGKVNRLLELGEALGGSGLWSVWANAAPETWPRVLVVDGIGALKYLYGYGQAAYVGGGFGRAVHSCLEPAAHGLGMAMGPRLGGSIEAQHFVKIGVARVVRQEKDLLGWLDSMEQSTQRESTKESLRAWLEFHSGASKSLLDRLKSDLKLKG